MNLYAYKNDKGDGVPINKEESSIYYLKAIKNQNSDAMYNYALVNKKDALKYYKMAADSGNSNAMNKYADMLDNGDGVPVDKEEAFHYYRMAINIGNLKCIIK